MSDSTSLRQELIQLQAESIGSSSLLGQQRRELDILFKTSAQLEVEEQARRLKIKETRDALAAAENREASLERAGEVSEEVKRLREKFERIAQGKVWYEGTGNNDAILPHQWEGMMFGAGAKRFICGDEMGLGKTRLAIGWLDLVAAKKVLIVCEANLCDQFAGEVNELAPHREVINLYKKTAAKRHELLDYALSKTDAVVVVNFEIWRKDKDALAKLLGWQIDTLIVDEAHNLKSTSTANFKYIEIIVKTDNVCGNCRKLVKGLYDPEKLPRKVPRPCPSCGWKYGDLTTHRPTYPLDKLLNTRSVKNICFTTGTPILNDPADLYSLLHLIDPILFRTKKDYLTAYCRLDHHSDKWEFAAGGMANLKPLIAGNFIARSLEDSGVRLPPQHIHHISVDLDKTLYPLQYRTIKQISTYAQIILDSGEATTIMHIMALITRKRQANVWPGGIEIRDTRKDSDTYGQVLFSVGSEVQESVKLDRIQENILTQHELGKRQIVFSQFKSALSEFETRLTKAGLRVARFDGDTSKDMRTRIKSNFDRSNNEVSEWDVVLCNYRTGGSGLNLTAATVTHILDEEWNPGKRNQSYARDHRIGQIEETEVYVYRVPGTVDTWLSNTIQRKERMIEGFMETMIETTDMRDDFLRALKSGEIL